MHVDFGTDFDGDDDHRGEIEQVLQAARCGSGEGRWEAPVDKITVMRHVSGSRTEAEVLEVALKHDGGGDEGVQQVAKIDLPARVKQDWLRYRKYFKGFEGSICTPVTAVTEGVLDDSLQAGERGAVFYQHVRERAGLLEEPVHTLEQLASRAMAGSDEDLSAVVANLARMLQRMGNVVHREPKPDARQGFDRLGFLAPRLGPALVLEVDNAHEGNLYYRPPWKPQAPRVTGARVREAAADSQWITATAGAFAVGSTVTLDLTGLEVKTLGSGEVLEGTAVADVKVQVRLAAEPDPTLRLPDFTGSRRVCGRIVGTRSHLHWELLKALLGDDLQQADGEVLLGENRVGHPFAHLKHVLHDPFPHWVGSLVHGDLNPRNILFVADEAFLIDYAEAEEFSPLAGDYAWLEFGLLRDVIAPRLSDAELLRLCRVLCFVSRCPSIDARTADRWACAEATAPFRAAYRLLSTVRTAARQRHPGNSEQVWWKEYLCQMTLAACRTLKWSRDTHDRDTAAAAVAASGVAGEFLEPAAPEAMFRHWQRDELRLLLEHLLPTAPVELEEGLHIFAAALRAFDSPSTGGPTAPGLIGLIDATQARAVRSLCRNQALQVTSRHSERTAKATIRLRATYERFGRKPPTEGNDRGEADALAVAATASTVVVLGDAGAGKTTLAEQLAHRHALAVLEDAPEPDSVRPLLPVLVNARALPDHLRTSIEPGRRMCAHALLKASIFGLTMSLSLWDDLLSVGGLHVTVDGLNELTLAERDLVMDWLRRLRHHYPRTPLMLCHRSSGSPARELKLDTLTLCKVTTTQAHSYIWDRLRENSTSDEDHSPTRLINWLFENPADRRIEELARTPLFLSMTVEWYNSTGALPASVGELLTRFTHWYLSGRHDDGSEQAKDSQHGATEKARILEKIAGFMVEGSMSEVSWDRLRAWLHREGESDAEPVLKEIFSTEMLWHEDGRVGFLHQLFQEYFAARELVSCSFSVRQRRVLAFRWQESVRILFGLPDVASEVIAEVLATARQARPAYAAWLLRHAHSLPSPLSPSFLSEQKQTLSTPFAGPTAWQESAEALAELATPQAWDLLSATVCSPEAPLGARQAALRFLGEARREVPASREDLDRVFGNALDVALRPASPPGLKEAAFRAAGRAHVTAFAGFAWEHVAPGHSWSVTREAYHAVKMLGLRSTTTLDEVYLQVCRRRLRNVVRELRHTSDTQTVRSLDDERFDILTALAHHDTLEILLGHRFAPGLVSRYGWDDLLLRAARHRLRLQPKDETAAIVVGSDYDPGVLLRTFTSGDELAALAAAHRLLTDRSVATQEVLRRVDAQTSASRLLAAAAFVELMGTADAGAATDLIRALIKRVHCEMPPAGLDALAAFIDSLGHSRPALRAELADEASLVLQARGVVRAMHWPWLTVWSEAAPDSRDLVGLLERPEPAAHATAIRHMSATDFLLCAAEELPELNMSDQALRNFQRSRPDLRDGPAVSQFAAAVAFGGITEEYEFMLDAVMSRPLQAATLLQANSRHGVLQRTCADNAVAALGYLGRLLLNRQDSQSLGRAQKAKATLLQLPTDLPTSLERARRVALGLLGDWQSLLFDLSSDPLLRDAAYNIITRWEPVPWAPDTSRLRDIAVDVANLLGDPEFQDPAAREVLQKVKADLQDRIGSYVLASTEDPRTGREAV